MVDNIEKVLERGEKIELLVDKTDNLRFQVGALVVGRGRRSARLEMGERGARVVSWGLSP